jgi:hypothetical protein
MANRSTRFILKNNANSAAPFSGATLLAGEPIVNTAAGIMMFSGVTSGSDDWVPAGIDGNANFFEVGSNLHNLKIRNQITSYSGVTNLTGKFLSGTTNGFVLADISTIVGVDTYVTGFTYNDNILTIKQNVGQADLTAVINTMTGLTVNGILSATTANFDTSNITTLNLTGGSVTAAATNPNDIVNYDTLTGYSQANSIYVTAGTVSYTGPNGSIVLDRKNASNVTITGLTDIYLTGGTYNSGTLTLNDNNDGSFNVTGLTSTDTFVTGFTYSPTTNIFTIKQNQGQSDLTVDFNTVSGLTVSNLTAGRVVYVGASGILTDEAGFTYDANTNTLSVPSDGAVSVGTGGLSVAGDAVIQGSLTVFGPAISAFTSQLYVEDPNITINYNPTGNTTSTSIGAGWTLQDGNGVNGGDVNLDIRALDTLTGLTATQIPSITEYTTSTGYSNRGWVTQLNDIVIRSTNISTPNGVRVLTEFDVLDGGQY